MDFNSPEWKELSEQYCKAADDYQASAMELWNSLPYDDRLKLFCAVCGLIYEGDIKRKGTYRYVLYDVCGFGPDAYATAQHAGYLSIHNAIFDSEHIDEAIKDFVTNHLDVTKDNLDEQISKFVLKQHL